MTCPLFGFVCISDDHYSDFAEIFWSGYDHLLATQPSSYSQKPKILRAFLSWAQFHKHKMPAFKCQILAGV